MNESILPLPTQDRFLSDCVVELHVRTCLLSHVLTAFV